jgi:hypothetical protein
MIRRVLLETLRTTSRAEGEASKRGDVWRQVFRRWPRYGEDCADVHSQAAERVKDAMTRGPVVRHPSDGNPEASSSMSLSCSLHTYVALFVRL